MNIAQDSLSGSVDLAFARLERGRGFERREGQLEMAARWSAALERGGTLAVEAPTGIGKSLAYLIPALLHRGRGSGPILVSTHTKALQEQLVREDAPLACEAAGTRARVVALLGRASYLCRRRAEARLAQRRLFASDEGGPGGLADEAFAALEEWIAETPTGALDELPALWVHASAAFLAALASEPSPWRR